MGKGIVHNLDLLQSWAPTLVQRALAMAGESPVLAVHLPLSTLQLQRVSMLRMHAWLHDHEAVHQTRIHYWGLHNYIAAKMMPMV